MIMMDRREMLRGCGVVLCGIALVACDDDGPAEQAGEKIDDTIEKAGDAVEDATD